MRPRAITLVLCLAMTSGCWSKGVIPKEPATAGATLAQKNDPCAADSECEGDLVCDAERCITWHRMKGDVPEITATELAERIEEGSVQVLDVRTGLEFAMGHAEGAIHVPIGQLDDALDDLPLDPSKPVVAICLTAHRSIAAVRLLQRHGYDVVQLERGWRAVTKDFPKAKGKYEPRSNASGTSNPADRKPSPPPEKDLEDL